MQQILHHAEHTVNTFGEQMDFLAGLKYRKFGRGKHATGNETQTRLFVFFFRTNNGTHGTFNQFHSPDQQADVTYIKDRVESRQLIRNRYLGTSRMEEGIHHPIDKYHKGMKNNQYPNHTENVENEMGQSSSFRLRIGCQGSQICCNRSSDILTQHQCSTKLQADPSVGAHN